MWTSTKQRNYSFPSNRVEGHLTLYITSYKFKEVVTKHTGMIQLWMEFVLVGFLHFPPLTTILATGSKYPASFSVCLFGATLNNEQQSFCQTHFGPCVCLWCCSIAENWRQAVDIYLFFFRGGRLAFIPVYLSSPSASVPIKALHLDVQEAEFTDGLFAD